MNTNVQFFKDLLAEADRRDGFTVGKPPASTRLEFQAEIERGSRTRIINVVAHGGLRDDGTARVALLEWTPGLSLTEGEQSHLMSSAKWRMESQGGA